MRVKIFINYRRGDERSMTARIGDRLTSVFGSSNVFMDVDNMVAGQRFDRELEKAVAETHVFLSVIGPRWMDLFESRQSADERDYVRAEIAEALKRGIVMIPVLIEGAPLPQANALPEDICELVLHQKHCASHHLPHHRHQSLQQQTARGHRVRGDEVLEQNGKAHHDIPCC